MLLLSLWFCNCYCTLHPILAWHLHIFIVVSSVRRTREHGQMHFHRILAWHLYIFIVISSVRRTREHGQMHLNDACGTNKAKNCKELKNLSCKFLRNRTLKESLLMNKKWSNRRMNLAPQDACHSWLWKKLNSSWKEKLRICLVHIICSSWEQLSQVESRLKVKFGCKLKCHKAMTLQVLLS